MDGRKYQSRTENPNSLSGPEILGLPTKPRRSAGLTIFFRGHTRASFFPVAYRPAIAFTWPSRPQACANASRPRPPYHRTSSSSVKSAISDAVLANDVLRRQAGFVFLQNAEDLFFAASLAFHLESSLRSILGGNLSLILATFSGERSIT